MMVTRVAVIGILIEDPASVEQVNALLHRHAPYILGRMGIPYRERNISIISIAIDAPQDVTNALTGELGRLPGVNAKAVYSHVITAIENGGDKL